MRSNSSLSGVGFIVLIVVGLVSGALFFANFYSNCQENGGSVGLIFSGEGGFKCSDSEGRIIDVF